MKRRPYPGVYNAGPVVNAGAFVRDLLDGMETCNSDCALFLTLRRTPDDISEFLDIFNVPQGVNVNWKRARSVVVTDSHMGSIVKRQQLELDALVKAIMYPTFIGGVKSLNYAQHLKSPFKSAR